MPSCKGGIVPCRTGAGALGIEGVNWPSVRLPARPLMAGLAGALLISSYCSKGAA
jgi:hypothetical protein